MSPMTRVVAPKAHGHIDCSDLMILQWNKSLRVQMKLVESLEADLEEARERALHLFEVGGEVLIYTRSLKVYNCDPRRKTLLHSSVSERASRFWRRGLTRSSLLEMVVYNASGVIPPQHPGRADVMTNNPRLLREKVLYQHEPTSRAGKLVV